MFCWVGVLETMALLFMVTWLHLKSQMKFRMSEVRAISGRQRVKHSSLVTVYECQRKYPYDLAAFSSLSRHEFYFCRMSLEPSLHYIYIYIFYTALDFNNWPLVQKTHQTVTAQHLFNITCRKFYNLVTLACGLLCLYYGCHVCVLQFYS